MNKQKIIDIMEKEMVVALGCTDPVAIAYAAAAARKLAPNGKITGITIKLSKSIIKSAASVKIPGTSVNGVKMAAVLGALFGDSDKKLEVLEGINDSNVEIARKFLNENECTVSEIDNDILLYLEIILKTEKDTARTILIDDYSNWVYAELNGDVIFDRSVKETPAEVDKIEVDLSIEEIWEFINNGDMDTDFEIPKKSILLNENICREGLNNKYGLQVGRTMSANSKSCDSKIDIMTYAVALTAAGADARMAGSPMPVLSNSGSGNQGITATIPVVAVAEKLDLDEEIKIRAVALSNLITIYAKEYFGRISALCGANIAAMGASCGVVYLFGGGIEKIKSAIQNMAGNVTGMFCDGAKAGCALKVSTSVQAAMQSAFLAIDGIMIEESDGIIEKNVVDTLKNIGKMSSGCSYMINNMIVDIMIHKQQKG
ncbi:MAG: serine dehydratase subunit alpha family protein [Clostridiales bacterium]|nr:serine dehydratase subunit alpha family protein [Clostridiales bacterium]